MNKLSDDRIAYKYPMRRSGGLFLILIGMTLLLSLVLSQEELVSHRIFAVGVLISILSFSTIRYFSHGRPSKFQITALSLALGLEFVLFIMLLNILPHDTPERDKWLFGSIAVGIHFAPMAYSFGKILLFLSLACIINAVVGLLVPQIPYEVLGILDGLLKTGVGILMFRIIRTPECVES